MRSIFKPALAAALLSATAMGHAACYTVFKADGTILLETSEAPVDLSEQIGDTIPARFGAGATMTMSEHGFYCGSRPGEIGTANSLADAVRIGCVARRAPSWPSTKASTTGRKPRCASRSCRSCACSCWWRGSWRAMSISETRRRERDTWSSCTRRQLPRLIRTPRRSNHDAHDRPHRRLAGTGAQVSRP